MSAAQPHPAEQPVIRVRDLHVALQRGRGQPPVRAVNGISFSIGAGRTMGIVGESGCGKSTASMALLRLLPKTAVTRGEVCFDGMNLLTQDEAVLRQIRGRRISMIFQDPMVALDPLFTVGEQLAEPLRQHVGLKGDELRARQIELLQAVGISSPETRLSQYPHQMSGGMLQRIVGAIAISCNPELLIADEPTTALDPRAQAAYLDLLEELSRAYGLALVIVTHDMGVVARICDDVMVMYAGQAVEQGPVRQIFNDPKHPYTQALLASIPSGSSRDELLPTIQGQPPNLAALPEGCAFAARCPRVQDRCGGGVPPVAEFAGEQVARCWRAGEP